MNNPKLVNALIDIFENFLEERNIEIYNDDKTGEPDEAIIYGSDYFELEEKINQCIENHNK